MYLLLSTVFLETYLNRHCIYYINMENLWNFPLLQADSNLFKLSIDRCILFTQLFDSCFQLFALFCDVTQLFELLSNLKQPFVNFRLTCKNVNKSLVHFQHLPVSEAHL